MPLLPISGHGEIPLSSQRNRAESLCYPSFSVKNLITRECQNHLTVCHQVGHFSLRGCKSKNWVPPYEMESKSWWKGEVISWGLWSCLIGLLNKHTLPVTDNHQYTDEFFKVLQGECFKETQACKGLKHKSPWFGLIFHSSLNLPWMHWITR